MSRLLCKIEGDIPPNLSIPNDRSILVISKSQRYLTHGLHKYPAKFIPEYPRWAIQKYAFKNHNLILEPFCGSGTSNVEAKLAGYDSLAIDVDPLARLITKVKTTHLDENLLTSEKDRLLHSFNKLRIQSDLPENYELIENWFRPEVAHRLSFIHKSITDIDDENTRNFFLVCLSSTIRRVSNADPNLVLPKISRFMRAREQKGRKINVFDTFEKILVNNCKRIMDFSKTTSQTTKVEIIGNDARNINAEDDSISIAVTSPPYLNAHDYVRAHKLEMFWLGMIKNSDDLKSLDRNYVGTERIYAKEYSEIPAIDISELDLKIKSISKIDKKRAYITAKFFLDMDKHFQEIFRILQERGHYVMFVGNNVVRKTPILTHKYLTTLAERNNLKTELRFSSPLIKRFEVQSGRKDYGGFIDSDWILVFGK